MLSQINFDDEIIVDNFAGGGGASTGIELALGRPVNIAINHDPDAILMHKTNHPYTEHYQESVWDINPVEICRGRKVGLAWFSPDCKHFSKAKGSKPVEKKIRGLAWVVLRWAGTVRPRVIILENVEEFQTWGPVRKGKPIKSKQGETFNKFISQLCDLGYDVEYRELAACDFGAPTIRKRFFMIARCDGQPIVWPQPTHASQDDERVKKGQLKPFRSAAECIDFSLACPSIFERKKELVVNTQRRIARGLDKFVIREQNPFIIPIGYGENKGQAPRVHNIKEPLSTVVGSCKQYLVTPYFTTLKFNNEASGIKTPLTTITSVNCHYLISPYLTKFQQHSIDHNALTASYLVQYYGGPDHSSNVAQPLNTITVQPRHFLCKNFLTALQNNIDATNINLPINTITTKNHFALTRVYIKKYVKNIQIGYWPKVREMLNKYTDWCIYDDEILIFNINGIEYFISDIGLRMLQPAELYRCQGFPSDYIIERDYKGNVYPKTKQIARCGNAVPPPFAKALVQANLPELCQNVYIDTMTMLHNLVAV